MAVLRKTIVQIGFLRGASILLAFIQTIVLARLLGIEQFGLYSIVMSVIAVLTVPLIRGCPTLVVRATARLKDGCDLQELSNLVKMSDTIGLWWMSTTTLLILLLGYFSFIIPSGQTVTVLLGCLTMLFVLMANIRSAITWGMGRTTLGHLPDQVIRPFAFIIIFLAFAFGDDFSVAEAMAASCFSALLTLCFAKVFLARQKLLLLPKKATEMSMLPMMKALLPLSSIAGMQMLNSQLDIIVLGAMRSTDEVGLYKLAATISSQVSVGLTLAMAAYSPTFASLFRQGKHQELAKVFNRSAQLSMGIGLFAYVFVVIVVVWGLEFGFPPEFAEAKWPTIALGTVHLLTLWTAGANTLLVMAGDEGFVMKTILISTAIKLVISIPLIHHFGVWGAVVAGTVSLMFWRISIWSRYRRIILS